MRLKKPLCILLCLVFILMSASVAFAMPSFSYYSGTVKYSDGTLVQSGKVQGFLNGQLVAKAVTNIDGGNYTVGVGGDTVTNKDQPVTFEVIINDIAYQASTDPPVVSWKGEMDQSFVNLTVGVTLPPADPTASPAPGQFTSSVNVALSCATPGADIYYTLDGTSPGAGSSIYSSPINLTETTTIKAKAYKNGLWSNEKTFTYTKSVVLPADPTASPGPGTYQDSVIVTLSSTTTGAQIYYTLDGTSPGAGSTIFTTPIYLTETTTIKAKAYKDGQWSSEKSFLYTITYAPPANPTASPAPGTYQNSVDVSLSCTTSGADIYYTLDGTSPSLSSAKYTAPINLTQTKTIKAKAYKSGVGVWSSERSFTYTITYTPPADPTASPAPGQYDDSVNVVLSSATAGAEIYYTLDGTSPSLSSAKYTAPIHITQTTTVKAKAYKNAKWSGEKAFTYTISVAAPADPTASPAPGSFTSSVDVTLSCITPGADIYYTLDGTSPGLGSSKYSTPIRLTQNTTIKAKAYKDGVWSGEKTFTYTKSTPPADPAASPAPGTYQNSVNVTLSSATSGAEIYYTLDGTSPGLESAKYTAPISLTQTKTIKAKAYKNGLWSSEKIFTYTINVTPPAAPAASPAPGTYQDSVNVTLSSATSGAEIYYTLDGTSPGLESAKYTAPINLTQTKTIKAKSYKNGAWSSEKSFTYTINVTPPAAPTASPAPGTYQDSVNVTLSCTTSGAEIYYTLDGTSPDLGSNKYSSPVQLTQTATIKAKAYRNGAWSSEKSFTYTINVTPPAVPAASPAPGEFTDSVDVTLSCTTPGAEIYYTLDGTSPSLGSAKYSAAIHLTQTTTIKAKAYKNSAWSGEATFVYTKYQDPVRTVEIALDNHDAVNSTRRLGIFARAFENSQAKDVIWTATVKDEQGKISGLPLLGTGSEFTGSWKPTEQEIPKSIPVTREYMLEVKADFAGHPVVETRDITLTNYLYAIKGVKLNGNTIEVKLEDLGEGGGTVDCIFQFEKDGKPVSVVVMEDTAINGTVSSVSCPVPSGLSGSYNVTVFVWDLGDGEGNSFTTLANPVTLLVNN